MSQIDFESLQNGTPMPMKREGPATKCRILYMQRWGINASSRILNIQFVLFESVDAKIGRFYSSNFLFNPPGCPLHLFVLRFVCQVLLLALV